MRVSISMLSLVALAFLNQVNYETTDKSVVVGDSFDLFQAGEKGLFTTRHDSTDGIRLIGIYLTKVNDTTVEFSYSSLHNWKHTTKL
ncbi:MAG: hypothetical protein AAGI38_18705 [Bacteroidota bacterium]